MFLHSRFVEEVESTPVTGVGTLSESKLVCEIKKKKKINTSLLFIYTIFKLQILLMLLLHIKKITVIGLYSSLWHRIHYSATFFILEKLIFYFFLGRKPS